MNFQSLCVLFYMSYFFVYEKTHSYSSLVITNTAALLGWYLLKQIYKSMNLLLRLSPLVTNSQHSPWSLSDTILVCSISIIDTRSEINILEKNQREQSLSAAMGTISSTTLSTHYWYNHYNCKDTHWRQAATQLQTQRTNMMDSRLLCINI